MRVKVTGMAGTPAQALAKAWAELNRKSPPNASPTFELVKREVNKFGVRKWLATITFRP